MSLNFDTIDESAKGGIHYTRVSRTLRFGDGQKNMTVEIDIIIYQSEASQRITKIIESQSETM